MGTLVYLCLPAWVPVLNFYFMAAKQREKRRYRENTRDQALFLCLHFSCCFAVVKPYQQAQSHTLLVFFFFFSDFVPCSTIQLGGARTWQPSQRQDFSNLGLRRQHLFFDAVRAERDVGIRPAFPRPAHRRWPRESCVKTTWEKKNCQGSFNMLLAFRDAANEAAGTFHAS